MCNEKDWVIMEGTERQEDKTSRRPTLHLQLMVPFAFEYLSSIQDKQHYFNALALELCTAHVHLGCSTSIQPAAKSLEEVAQDSLSVWTVPTTKDT